MGERDWAVNFSCTVPMAPIERHEADHHAIREHDGDHGGGEAVGAERGGGERDGDEDRLAEEA